MFVYTFRNDAENKNKYHLFNWQSLAQKKDFGGWDIPDLRNLNLCLLAFWINMYHLSDHVICKKIIDHKYNIAKPNIFGCPEVGVSPFRKGVLWASKAAMLGARWKVGDGKSIGFWEDHWLGDCSLAT